MPSPAEIAKLKITEDDPIHGKIDSLTKLVYDHEISIKSLEENAGGNESID